MSKRIYLKPGNKISLTEYDDKKNVVRTFTIREQWKEGGSYICYKAEYENGERGILKEFYPEDAYALDRNADGQLILQKEYGAACEKFEEERFKHRIPFVALFDEKNNGKYKEELASFIPAFKIYQGCDNKGIIMGTDYIWTPEPELQTFENLCRDIQAHPTKDPEETLVNVLKEIKALIECVEVLHKANFYHRDIKPENFGFRVRNEEIKSETLQFFDVNSICHIESKDVDTVFSEGYSEPECGQRPSCKTDIYSIGATLFHALVITDETEQNGNIYLPEYFSRISDMVRNSKLIQALKVNSRTKIKVCNLLAEILTTCLNKRSRRYKNCEQLLEQVDMVIKILTDARETDTDSVPEPTSAILYHLYKHPLYKYVENQDVNLNILIIGFGQFGSKFLDACLQAGQCQMKPMNIMIVSDDKADEELYLSERPELNKFFNVDVSMNINTSDSYGSITFKKETLTQDNIRKVIRTYCTSSSMHYIFVAMGDDEWNHEVAKTCQNALAEINKKCIISYAMEKSGRYNNEGDLIAVDMNADVQAEDTHGEIERMAFNTHLIWEKDLSNYNKIKSSFHEKYNHDSCISNVLSIKYKMHSIGIDLDEYSLEEAAKKFKEEVLDGKTKQQISKEDQLIWMEHRRWVVEKICDLNGVSHKGWTVLSDLTQCAGGNTKINDTKQHACLVRSDPNQNLAGWDLSKWDSATKEELKQLDALDQTSVRIHQEAVKAAKTKKELLEGNYVKSIQELTSAGKKSRAAFLNWYDCVKDIWEEAFKKVDKIDQERNSRRRELYNKLEKDLFSAVNNKRKAHKLHGELEQFDKEFVPVITAVEYRDLKHEDISIIENIPFVLTYSDHTCLIIPYTVGNNSDIFKNTASAIVLNPEKIIYVHMLYQKEDMGSFTASISQVIGILRAKGVRAKVEFFVMYTKNLDREQSHAENNLKEQIKKKIEDQKAVVKKVISISSFDQSVGKILNEITAVVESEKENKFEVYLEKNSSALSWMLMGTGFYHCSSSYYFANQEMQFEAEVKCDVLDYFYSMLKVTKKVPYISVVDMLAYHQAFIQSDDRPEFFEEYTELWKMYEGDRKVWKDLCNCLNEFHKKNDKQVVLKCTNKNKENNGTCKEEPFTWPIPVKYKDCAQLLFNEIKKHHAVGEDSCFQKDAKGYSVTLTKPKDNMEQYKKIFVDEVIKSSLDEITFSTEEKAGRLKIIYDELSVNGVEISEKWISLLQCLAEKHYISNLEFSHRPDSEDNEKTICKFTYATREVKELLTKAGRIFEIYVYREAKKSGFFDDVECGYFVDWEKKDDAQGYNVTSEFDGILTKGFRMLIVECKAQVKIDQIYYFKLDSLARKFGINVTAVLVADTTGARRNDISNNDMQARRGKMLNIITISKPDEIGNIGEILKEITNGEYMEKHREIQEGLGE